jgi:tetratricopeptide (TPR) repeat protein
MRAGERVADIFVSYTGSDRDWAFWIGNELRALGHVPHIHEWEIGSGEDIYAWMEQRHDAADHVLCVISDEYLKAPYSTLERNAALWQAISKRSGFALMVAVKPCRLPTLSDHLRRCELYGVDQSAAQQRFRNFMSKRGSSGNIMFPGQAFAISNVPIRVPEHFLGREEALGSIEAALNRYEGRVCITVLHGLRGVGKTTLAAAYAELHRSDYRAIWWIRAQTEAGMRADLAGLGVRLNWVDADDKEGPALAAVMERLLHEGQGILLIYDNAMDAGALKAFLPRGGAARVLVTSNAPAWRGVASPVEIRLWPSEIGAAYLLTRTGRENEHEAAMVLSNILGGLPLAHEQAAAYCERLDISLGDYAKRFEAAPARMLDSERDAPAEYHDRLTVAKTFSLAIDQAAKLHPAAASLIAYAALLAPEPIPLFLFTEAQEHLGEPLVAQLSGDGLDEAVAALRAFALVDRAGIVDERDPTVATDTIRLHRLVHRVARERQEGKERKRALARIVTAIRSVYPQEVWADPATWPRVRRLDSLALGLIDGEATEGTELDIAELLSQLAMYREWALGAYDEALAFSQRALKIREAVLGPDHLETAGSLNDLGTILTSRGDFAGARTAHSRALAIRERALGNAWLTGTSLNNLAVAVQGEGDLKNARPLRERSLAIFEKELGLDNFRTANNLTNLGQLMMAQGETEEARPLIERGLAIREKVLGPEHPHTAWSLNALGRLCQDSGDFGVARLLFERALAIDEKVLGPNHADTASCLGNLSRLYLDLGDIERARPLVERSLAIRQRIGHSDQPLVADSFNLLGQLLRQSHQYDEAELYFRRATELAQRVLGEKHWLTQRYRSCYARLLLDTGRAAEAQALASEALAVHASVNGPGHRVTREAAEISAGALDALGRGGEASALRTQYELKA